MDGSGAMGELEKTSLDMQSACPAGDSCLCVQEGCESGPILLPPALRGRVDRLAHLAETGRPNRTLRLVKRQARRVPVQSAELQHASGGSLHVVNNVLVGYFEDRHRQHP